MTRYIEADELAEKAWRVGVRTREDLIDFIKTSPTIDAVEVVRCKDCTHREVQVDGVFRYEMCGIRNEIINLNGFCHMGERRKDGKTE